MPSTDKPTEFWGDRPAAPPPPAETLSEPPLDPALTTRIGASSLLRIHQNVRPPLDVEELEQPDEVLHDGTPVWSEPRAPGKAIPSQCLRVLNSPLPPERGGGCVNHFGGICPGTQRDGGCLADVVKQAQADGRDWSFEINRHVGDPPEGYWDLVDA